MPVALGRDAIGRLVARRRAGGRDVRRGRLALDGGHHPVVVCSSSDAPPRRRGEARQRRPEVVDRRDEVGGGLLGLDPLLLLDLDSGHRLGEFAQDLAETGGLRGLALLRRSGRGLDEPRQRLELGRLRVVLLDQLRKRLRDAGILDLVIHLFATGHPFLLQAKEERGPRAPPRKRPVSRAGDFRGPWLTGSE